MVIAIDEILRLEEKLRVVPDYRRKDEGNIRHKLIDILVLTFTAVLCGFKEYEEIEQFCREKVSWFKQFLELPQGIPDAITFYRVVRMIEPGELAKGLQAWLFEVDLQAGYEVNIDGKTMRGSIRANFKGCHIVSAWVGAKALVLGEVRTEAHSNEITAIPQLLDMLAIGGMRVTIDAEGCQKEIAAKIIDKGADYTLAVKENQKALYEQIKDCFDWEEQDKWADIPRETEETDIEKGHGRIEKRECSVIHDIDWLYQKEAWKGIRSIVKVRCHRSVWSTEKGVWLPETTYDRYYISSLSLSAKETNGIIRRHWSIENSLHWVLDVDFGEDSDLKRTLHAPENMNIFRKTALSCIKIHEPEPDRKKSLRYFSRKALLNDDYRSSLLFGRK
jgi:predicted transposase YbfD/YdcC